MDDERDNLSGEAPVLQVTDGGGAGGAVAAAAVKPKRDLGGRPPGLPKTGGRAKGTPNRATTVGREFIIKKSSSLPFLCDVSAGRKVKVADPTNPSKKIDVYPSFEQRLRASGILAPMVVPVLKATELTGKDGGAVALTLIDFLRGLPD